jgi:hypothetical protein
MNLIFHEMLGSIVDVYIDDIIVKLAAFDSHLANLRKSFDKMRRYYLKMNPRKCAFVCQFEFTIHEHGVEVDPDRIRAIQNVGASTYKFEMQKFFGNIN